MTIYPGSQPEVKQEWLINFLYDSNDYGHLNVVLKEKDGKIEQIGHVYTEVTEEGPRYFTTNAAGRDLFPITMDFSLVVQRFDGYAYQIECLKQEQIIKSFKNINLMQTNQQNFEQNQRKINQVIFVEYEKALSNGHFTSVVDSYRNLLGRIHKVYNEELQKYEYFAYDHEGKPMGEKSEKLWQLKKEFTDNREALLEQAHQRRIASKERTQQPEQPEQPAKTTERKKETEKVRQDKSNPDKQVNKSKAESKNKQGRVTRDDRSQELEDVRDGREEDFDDIER